MAFSTLIFASCNKDDVDPNGTDAGETTPPEETTEVLRLTNDIASGAKITEADIEIVSLRKIDIPINAMSNKDDVVGKYAVSALFKGDFLLPSKLSAVDPSTIGGGGSIAEEDLVAYTLITKYHALVKDGDYTAAINKAIEENPNGTIYFPDGEYKISDTIVISADAATGVSFRLSNYATIKAVNWTDKTVPMIRIGVESEAVDGESGIHDVRNTYIMGGVIDASGVASGISVDGGWDITLSNITITGSYYGLHIKYAPNELGATCADVENVNVVGNGETGSVGILLEGTQNTLTNMKVSDVQYALKCTETGSDNVLRSIMAIGTGLTGTDNAGFWDMSAGNQYDICYSDQYATGFLMEERTRSVYNGCRVSWWSADNDYHVGFRAVGKFNSTVLYSKVYHDHTVKTDAYLLVGADGGEGTVQYPIKQIVSTEYDSVLAKYCSTDILN